MLLGIFGFALYNVCLNYGERTVTAGVASFIIGFIPVFVMLLASWLYHERLNHYVRIGLCVSLLGLFFILLGESKIHFDLGVLWIMAATLGGGIYTLFQKRFLIRMNAIEFTAYAIWGGTLALLVYAPHLSSEIHRASYSATAVVIYMGLVPGAIAYVCWSYGFKHLNTAQAVSYSYWIPLCSILLALIFLHEIPSLTSLFGGILTILGAIVINKYSMKI
jgi:drug/metabolite transporter (DMT)-like permease